MTNSASPISVTAITATTPEPGVFVDMSFLLDKTKPIAQFASDNGDLADNGSDYSGSSSETESSSEDGDESKESSVSSIYSSESDDDSSDDSSCGPFDLDGIEVLALAKATQPGRTLSNCSLHPVGADTAARKPKRSEDATEEQVFSRLLAGNRGAASSLQNMIQQAEKAATMNLLKEQQEKQGATHELVDKKPKAPSRSGDFAPQPLKRTSSIANFQAMGRIMQQLPRELGGDVRQSLKRTNSITNFQAMGHNKEKARAFFDKPADKPSSESGDSFNSSESAASALAQLLVSEQVNEIVKSTKGGHKRRTSKIFAGTPKPDDHLASLLGNPGYFAYDSMTSFFLESTQEQIDLWDSDLVTALRQQDLKALKDRHRQGKSLQACNQFGESIIHLCVRRGNPKMLKFLMREAGASIRVCCDFGRTPMHDVCWSLSNTASTPAEERFAMMHMLLEACPLLLFIRDKRGHTPLSYVPKNKWAECNAFLDRFQAEGGLEVDGQQIETSCEPRRRV